MAVAKNTLLAVLLIALNNNVAAFMPPASTRVSSLVVDGWIDGFSEGGIKRVLAHLTRRVYSDLVP